MNWLKKTIVWQLALIILLIISWPLLRPEFFRMHDYTHVARLVEMVDALRAGHFPVHWSANFGWGYGMPLFLFYGPAPFYIASIPVLLGIAPLSAIKILIFISHLLAWTGMYKVLSRWGRVPAVVGATAFLLTPYRAVDLYVRGALNELFALSLLPWILYFSWTIAFESTSKKWRWGCLGLSLSVALLVMSHNLTAMIAAPFLAIMGFLPLIIKHRFQLRARLLWLTGGWLGGALLSAGYAIPAFLEKDLTIVNQITRGYFNYQLHFLYIRQFWQNRWDYGGSVFGPDDNISFHLGRLTLVLAISCALAVSWKVKDLYKNRQLNRHTWLKWWLTLPIVTGLLLVFSLWMTTFHAQPIWDRLLLLHYIQFPWRFLAVSNFLLALLAGWSLWFIRPWWRRWLWGWLSIILLLLTQLPFHQPQEFLSRNEDFYYTDKHLIREKMSDILNDYVPQTFNRQLEPVNANERFAIRSVPSEKLANYEYNLPHEFLLLLPEPVPGRVVWNIAHFPGWHYTINHQEVTTTLRDDGRMEFATAENINSVGAYYSYTPLRSWWGIVSAGTAILWLSLASPWIFSTLKWRQRG